MFSLKKLFGDYNRSKKAKAYCDKDIKNYSVPLNKINYKDTYLNSAADFNNAMNNNIKRANIRLAEGKSCYAIALVKEHKVDIKNKYAKHLKSAEKRNLSADNLLEFKPTLDSHINLFRHPLVVNQVGCKIHAWAITGQSDSYRAYCEKANKLMLSRPIVVDKGKGIHLSSCVYEFGSEYIKDFFLIDFESSEDAQLRCLYKLTYDKNVIEFFNKRFSDIGDPNTQIFSLNEYMSSGYTLISYILFIAWQLVEKGLLTKEDYISLSEDLHKEGGIKIDYERFYTSLRDKGLIE